MKTDNFDIARFLVEMGTIDFQIKPPAVTVLQLSPVGLIVQQLIEAPTATEAGHYLKQCFLAQPMFWGDRAVAKVVKAFAISLDPPTRQWFLGTLLSPFWKGDESHHYQSDHSVGVAVGVLRGAYQAACWIEANRSLAQDKDFDDHMFYWSECLLKALYRHGPWSTTSCSCLALGYHRGEIEAYNDLAKDVLAFASPTGELTQIRRRAQVERLRQELLTYADREFAENRRSSDSGKTDNQQKCWDEVGEFIMRALLDGVCKKIPLYFLLQGQIDPEDLRTIGDDF